MPALTVDRLHKSYGTRVVFDGVSFSIEEGEKVGFIGVNGSGKSTLFRIVAGEEGSEGGTLAYRRGLSVGYLAQDPDFAEGDTILAAVAGGRPELLDAIAEYHHVAVALSGEGAGEMGPAGLERLVARQGVAMERIDALGGWDYEHRLEAVLTRLGVDDWDRPLGPLSGGERKRVALARVLVQQPELLLLDEPTNHLDADTTEWLEDALLDYPGAVMLITHDRYFLDRMVTRMIEVNRAELIPFPGGFTEYLEAKAEREARLSVEEDKRSKLIAQELEWAKRAPKARTGKQKARIQRLDRTRQKQEAEKRPEQEMVELKFGKPPRLGRKVLDLDGISKSYDGRPLIRDFTTQLRGGERIGIVGPNGVGKTTLLRMILGEEEPDSGEVKPGVNTVMAYYDQARADLDPDADLLETVAGHQEWVEVAGRSVHVRSYLNSYLFPNEIHEQKVRSLSGGEKNRLLLARLLTRPANLLILDEPTNDLDLFTLQVLESALVDFPGCVLVVTHDRYFLDKVATALFVFEGDGHVHRHEGGYDAYRRRKEAAEKEEAERAAERAAAERDRAARARGGGGGRGTPAGASNGKAAGPGSSDRPRKLTFREQRELDGIEAEITAAESERDRLEAVLADPSLYSDSPEDVAGLSEEFDAARGRVETLYARWEELESVRSGRG